MVNVARKRNLIYHIYFDGTLNHYHKVNLALLTQYKGVFNGEVICKLAIEKGTDISAIKDRIPFKFEIVQNNKLGEANHFIDSLKRISGGQTFYAHCKGVTRPVMWGLEQWIIHLYKWNLEDYPRLTDKIFSGVCGKLLPCPPYVPEPFHYSGSFYWFNHDSVKWRWNWIQRDYNNYLTERLPGMLAKFNECEFRHVAVKHNISFYSDAIWRKIAYNKKRFYDL